MYGRKNKKIQIFFACISISFLVNFLKNKNINFLDLAGYNPVPRNEKEKGIKKFKEKFYGQLFINLHLLWIELF